MNEEEYEKLSETMTVIKKAYSKHLEKIGLDESYYPIKIIIYQVFGDSDFTSGKKLIEVDDRELNWSEKK